MKFVITGAAGHVSTPLAERLLGKGHDVTVVGRNAGNLTSLIEAGAKPAIGDLRDVPFLTRTFARADCVYLMLPPLWDVDDQKESSEALANGFALAIKGADVHNALFLSSYGAHRLDDAGAISGMGRAERILASLDGVNVLSLRAGYFYTNLLLSLDLVRKEGHLGNMFSIPAGTFTVVDPDDIAAAAAGALNALDFSGHSYRYVISDLTGTDEIASLIGREIGVPDLRWVKFPVSAFKQTLLGYGFADGAANDYVEMFTALDRGVLFEHIQQTRPAIGGRSIEDFAKEFAAAYDAATSAAKIQNKVEGGGDASLCITVT